jgi:hypothetical protein
MCNNAAGSKYDPAALFVEEGATRRAKVSTAIPQPRNKWGLKTGPEVKPPLRKAWGALLPPTPRLRRDTDGERPPSPRLWRDKQFSATEQSDIRQGTRQALKVAAAPQAFLR